MLQKRGDKLKKISNLISFFCAFIILSTNIYASNSYEWYCNRMSDHSQPRLDSNLSFVDECDGIIWIDKKHSSFNDANKKIYLTFDAGYENGNIEKILDVLKEENVKATFFILDNLISSNKCLVKRMIDEGHLIGNHTSKHKDMSKIADIEKFRRELESLENLFYETFGSRMTKYYRPPEGRFSKENIEYAKELGYKTIMWSFAYADWDNSNQMSADKAMEKILNNLHNGEIMLLHPTSSTNVEIMRTLIIKLKDLGYEFHTVNEISS